MSWNVSLAPVSASEMVAAIEAATIPVNKAFPVSEEAQEQFAAAKKAAIALFLSGAVGDPTTGLFGDRRP